MKSGSRAYIVGAILAALTPAGAQDAPKPQDDKVAEAISQFRKAFKGSDAEKAAAFDVFKGLVHDKIISEVAKCADDGPDVKKRLISYLAQSDHPRSAEILASMIQPNIKDKAIMEELQKAASQLKWDSFYQPMAEALIFDKVYDKEMGSLSSGMVKVAEMTGSLVFVDQLIKVLKKVEESLKNPKTHESVKTYREGVLKALKVCTGEEKSDGKSYEAWWNGSRGSVEAKARMVMWCKSTGKRWDKLPNDSRAYCPHHNDRQEALRDPRVVAMRTLR